MAPEKSRVLVVDDHPIVLEGYRELINRQPDLTVCGVASSVKEALQEADRTRPHAAVVDLVLKDGHGLDLIKDLRTRVPGMRLLVVSARDEMVFAERALHAGASGYLSKAEATERLVDSIREVLEGRICLNPGVADRLLHRVSDPGRELSDSPAERLANRELEAFELIGSGLTTRQVASRMHISPKTVDRYRENIKEKLRLSNANELLRRAAIWVEENEA